MRQVVLVNGVPASGKSTAARKAVRHLIDAGVMAVPLGLDTVKEGLFAELGTGDREYNRLLGRASYRAIFDSIAGFPDVLVPVVDAWHGFQPVEVLRGHLERARIERVIELWCHVSPGAAAERYRRRAGRRHAGHLPASYAEELHELAARAGPLRLGPVVEINSERRLRKGALDQLHHHLMESV